MSVLLLLGTTVSDLVPSPVQLTSGLDLSTPKMMTEPGSMLDCLNYELVDFLGYRRISGFTRYDGTPYTTDLQDTYTVYTGVATTIADSPPFIPTPGLLTDNTTGEILGYAVSAEQALPSNNANIAYVLFSGNKLNSRDIAFDGGPWVFKAITGVASRGITLDERLAMETELRSLVVAPQATPVGLHWFRRNLYGVVPMLMIPYEASLVNNVVDYTIGQELTTSIGAGTAILRDKVVTVAASVSVAESGYLIVEDLGTGSLAANADDTYTLGGAVTVAAGSVYHQNGNLSGATSTACSLWVAGREPIFGEGQTGSGWTELPISYSATVTLSGITTEFSALRRGDASALYYFDDGADTVPVSILDWFVESGTFEDGDAVVVVQFQAPELLSNLVDITTSFDLYTDAGATVKVADVTTRMSLNYLPGIPQLTAANSRYLFLSSNFYASDSTDAVYGVNGAGRGFVFGGQSGVLSFIYTQSDEALDIPRHVENHAQHLALGFKVGSVQMSVAGQPTNFSGVEGASEIGVGDVITGLMEMNGSTLAVFCRNSIHSIAGTTVDNFDKQVISPKTGCIEYTLANIGEPIYLDSRGVCTLSASASYGDFANGRLSSKVSSYLRKRLRNSTYNTSNATGVACAIPVRDKNQYRIFFNTGEIITVTISGSQKEPGFTLQKYFINADSTTDYENCMIPFAWTSEVDDDGVERIFVSHYNSESSVSSDHVFALEAGDSFDGNYIPHYFVTNWYYGSTPHIHRTVQGVRLHGLSRGLAGLNITAVGAQPDFEFSDATFFTTATDISLPRNEAAYTEELTSCTNRADINCRGLAVKLRFSGSNTTLSSPEPSHVCQVLVVYSTPDGAFDL